MSKIRMLQSFGCEALVILSCTVILKMKEKYSMQLGLQTEAEEMFSKVHIYFRLKMDNGWTL